MKTALGFIATIFSLSLIVSCAQSAKTPSDSFGGENSGPVSSMPGIGENGIATGAIPNLGPVSDSGNAPSIPGQDSSTMAANGTDPLELPSNTSVSDIAKILSDWQPEWNQSAYNGIDPSKLSSEFQKIIQYIYCKTTSEFSSGLHSPVYILVMGNYLDLLGRLPAYDAALYWMNKIQNPYNLNGRLNAVLEIMRSEEYANRVVTEFYYGLLNMAPPADGLKTWAQRLMKGDSLESVIIGFVTSDKYRNRANKRFNNSDVVKRWVRALYKDLLGRDADKAGLEHWYSTYKSNGSNGFTVVAKGILDSDEARLKFIMNSYLRFLGRFPKADETYNVLNNMKNGHERIRVIGGILASVEYYQRQQNRFGAYTGSNSCQDF